MSDALAHVLPTKTDLSIIKPAFTQQLRSHLQELFVIYPFSVIKTDAISWCSFGKSRIAPICKKGKRGTQRKQGCMYIIYLWNLHDKISTDLIFGAGWCIKYLQKYELRCLYNTISNEYNMYDPLNICIFWFNWGYHILSWTLLRHLRWKTCCNFCQQQTNDIAICIHTLTVRQSSITYSKDLWGRHSPCMISFGPNIKSENNAHIALKCVWHNFLLLTT